MRPRMNPTHQTQTQVQITIRTAAKLLALCLIVAAVPVALYVRVNSAASTASESETVALTKMAEGRVRGRAAGRGRPFLNLKDGRDMTVTYRGDRAAAAALQTGAAQPRPLGSAGFRRHGVADVGAG